MKSPRMKKKTTKIGRNDPCPCGSGKKFKKCCGSEALITPLENRVRYAQANNIRLKTPRDVEMIRRAGRLALDTLDKVEAIIRPGI